MLDLGAAAAAISAERLAHGLSAVRVDRRLTSVAEIHALRMAADDRVEHVLPGEGSFAARLAEGGVEVAAAENIAGGPRTFDEALQLWRRSPAHAANLLRPEDARIGLAVAYAPAGRYRMYWSLIVAAADAAPTTEIGDVAVIWPASRPSGH